MLHRELGARVTIGIDSSRAMLGTTSGHELEGLRFELADIDEWTPAEPLDVVFSNAALHWLPDHRRLFTRLTTMLAPGGELAVQMPANFDHPSHTVAAEVAREAPFAEALDGYVRECPVLSPEAYAVLLDELGFDEQHVRLQVYGHTLESSESVIEWVRGTLLTDYEARMSEARFSEFLERYRARLLTALGDARPYFYPFKRVLLWGLRRRR